MELITNHNKFIIYENKITFLSIIPNKVTLNS